MFVSVRRTDSTSVTSNSSDERTAPANDGKDRCRTQHSSHREPHGREDGVDRHIVDACDKLDWLKPVSPQQHQRKRTQEPGQVPPREIRHLDAAARPPNRPHSSVEHDAQGERHAAQLRRERVHGALPGKPKQVKREISAKQRIDSTEWCSVFRESPNVPPVGRPVAQRHGNQQPEDNGAVENEPPRHDLENLEVTQPSRHVH
jgi:hypothetical protein